jgi:hypothetical protein
MAASNSAGQRRPTSKANGVKRLRLIQASQSEFSVGCTAIRSAARGLPRARPDCRVVSCGQLPVIGFVRGRTQVFERLGPPAAA